MMEIDDPKIAAAMAARTRLDEAMRTGDLETMRASFADDLVLQTPGHRIVDAAKILAVYAKAGAATYEGGMTARFDFVGERHGTVVMMGEEALPSGSTDRGSICRRFTDIWIEIDGGWKLMARQATNIPG